jgi:hypothetical protein
MTTPANDAHAHVYTLEIYKRNPIEVRGKLTCNPVLISWHDYPSVSAAIIEAGAVLKTLSSAYEVRLRKVTR